MRSQTIAYCWRNGVIKFGRSTPPGAIAIARGSDRVVRRNVTATARMAYDNVTLLVPGVPEATDSVAALDALVRHIVWLRGRESRAFKVAHEVLK